MAKYNYTIIIPHHNTPDLLGRCLQSIPERKDIDVLVIDDNSANQHIEQIENTCKQHANVRLTLTKEGLGAGYARNVGLKQMGDSRWLLFADADDYFLPEAWEHFDSHINDEADVLYFQSISRYSDTNAPGDRHIQMAKKIDAFISTPNAFTEGQLRYTYHEPVGKMIRTDIIRTNSLRFEQTRWANDVQFSTRLGTAARTIKAFCEKVYCVTISQGSLVHQHSLESRRCRYEVILRNNAYLRQIGEPQFQDSLMYSLRWAAKLGGMKAVHDFIKIGKKNNGDFSIGAADWLKNFFISQNEYKNKDKYIIRK